MMDHTKERARRHRGLLIVIFALLVVWFLEPGLHHVAEICGDFIKRQFGAP